MSAGGGAGAAGVASVGRGERGAYDTPLNGQGGKLLNRNPGMSRRHVGDMLVMREEDDLRCVPEL